MDKNQNFEKRAKKLKRLAITYQYQLINTEEKFGEFRHFLIMKIFEGIKNDEITDKNIDKFELFFESFRQEFRERVGYFQYGVGKIERERYE